MDDVDAPVRMAAFNYLAEQTLVHGDALPRSTHGLQGFHGATLTVPHSASLRPDRGFLEERYEPFRQAG